MMVNYFSFYIMVKHLAEAAQRGENLDFHISKMIDATNNLKMDVAEGETND